MFDKLRNAFKSFTNTIVNSITTTELSEDKLSEIRDNLFMQLVESDVAVDVAEAICDAIINYLRGLKVPRFGDKELMIRNGILEVMNKLFSEIQDVDLISEVTRELQVKKPVILLFLGPNGYGKTTTIAKVTHQLMKRGYTAVWAAADTYRAGAIEQLEGHAARLGIRVIKHGYGSDPAAVAYDAINHAKNKGIDYVMIDTAGRMHTDVNLMNELSKVQRVSKPDLSIFIADALLGNEALDIAKYYSKYVRIDGLIVTKVDAYPKGGAILTFLYELKRPIYFLGTGQNYDDLRPFNKMEFFRQLIL
ncbi:signal recognition particle-docking protein FtsY [Vulcanisaeta souniana]|uniref:Signal recognition particle-docking protein FtsY n=1 Tax=Vulcanisaeta souniana JCM 11219 TaxID=1293586 RepID=A0A830E3L2_9CREN|nr:signal recognition particle-docking protein FtsY [Vulcanisaeta souniana]BDR90932.1 signal recognition particle-docking protein FtsY [Vulcanisaeta souniana JCM 11219]GGI79421.1 signal recognition particle-docking protein FtsY [Vulcanisaeta souniana JCM 11219]